MALSLLERLEQRGFADLNGARLHIELPVSRALLNWYTSKLESATIHDVEIIRIRGLEVAVNVRTSIPFFKDRTLVVQFQEAIDRLTLAVEIIDGLGFLERTLIRPFLPDGLELDHRTLRIDLRTFLFREPRLALLADKIQNARVADGRGEQLLFIGDLKI